MSWIPKKNAGPTPMVATAPAPPRVQSSASLEMPVVMTVRRLPSPVYGTLMDVNAHGARIRSLVLLERGAEVEFALNIGGYAAITISGHVEARRNTTAGARFEYEVSFRTMAEAQIEAVARAVRDLERRAAAARTVQRQIDALPTTDAERRGSYRALSSIAARFRPEGGAWTEGKIGDISATGVRMNCVEMLQIGTMLEMRITLPSDVLGVYPEETAIIDTSGGAPKRIGGRPDMRRSFEEMALRARVVTRFSPVRDREVYGVAFIEIDGYQREEIARYTHAVQLTKMRK
jgi:hypothetical protein